MRINFDNDRSIYLQLAESIEDDILKGIFAEEEQIPSTTQMSVQYRINPATAAKGVNLLVDEGIIYKKRGIGMFVSKGAKEKIISKRKQQFYNKFILSMLEEAKKLGISKQELVKMIERREFNE